MCKINIIWKSRWQGFFLTAFAGTALMLLGMAPAQALDVNADISQSGVMKLGVTASGCNQKGGPTVTLGPEITFYDKNVPVTILFDGGGEHDATDSDTATVNTSIVLNGGTITHPKQGSQPDGVTGNPKISLWVDGKLLINGVRCNKLL
jgi:hypothetical protein